MPFLVFSTFGVWEALIVLAIVVVLFGASRIGDIGASMGRGIREFRRELKTPEEEEKEPAKAEQATPTAEQTASKSEPSQDQSSFQQ